MDEQFRSETRDAGLTSADLVNRDERTPSARGSDRSAGESPTYRINADRTSGRDLSSFSAPYGSGVADRFAQASSTGTTAESEEGDAATPLLSPDESDEFRARWDSVQVSFVDQPRQAVQQADSLVAGAMERLAEIFAEERVKLEGHWDRGDSVSTEDLRVALRRYRSFFGRLLSI
jgi:hypothetical protein